MRTILENLAAKGTLVSDGAWGTFLMTGEVSEEALYDVFREQAVALEAGGADACCIETMSDIDEARIAVRAAKENTKLEIVCTFTYSHTPDEMKNQVPALVRAGATIIGGCCGTNPKHIAAIAETLRKR